MTTTSTVPEATKVLADEISNRINEKFEKMFSQMSLLDKTMSDRQAKNELSMTNMKEMIETLKKLISETPSGKKVGGKATSASGHKENIDKRFRRIYATSDAFRKKFKDDCEDILKKVRKDEKYGKKKDDEKYKMEASAIWKGKFSKDAFKKNTKKYEEAKKEITAEMDKYDNDKPTTMLTNDAKPEEKAKSEEKTETVAEKKSIKEEDDDEDEEKEEVKVPKKRGRKSSGKKKAKKDDSESDDDDSSDSDVKVDSDSDDDADD
ncbi:Uncharacterised protein [uncultured archaeon]|nr:Uncharacterised protein [uncultured archaeon]